MHLREQRRLIDGIPTQSSTKSIRQKPGNLPDFSYVVAAEIFLTPW